MDGADVVRRQPFGVNPTVGDRGATTQRSILEAALGVFGDRGFAETRVELITKAAGCSRPAFYQYFSSKEDVFWRLAGHLARELSVLAGSMADITPGPEGIGLLEAWLGDLIDIYTAYQPVFISFHAAFRGGEHEPYQALPRTLSARIRKAFDHPDARRAVSSTGVGPDALADVVVAVILRSIHHWRLGLVDLPRARFTAALAAMVHRVLFGMTPGTAMSATAPAPAKTAPAWPGAQVVDGGSLLRPRGEATRQKLLVAASRVLPDRGFHDTRVDDIVAEAGISHGTFYRYFDNTEDLFRTLALGAAGQLAELVDRLAEASLDDRLHAWLVEWFGAYRSNGGVISAWQEIGDVEADMTTLSIDMALVFFDRLQRVVHQRGFGDSTADALALLAILERVPYEVVVLGYLDEGEAIAAAGHIIRRGILGGG